MQPRAGRKDVECVAKRAIQHLPSFSVTIVGPFKLRASRWAVAWGQCNAQRAACSGLLCSPTTVAWIACSMLRSACRLLGIA